MKSIFTGPQAAFSPFFDTYVAITGERRNGARVHGSFRACVFDDGFDEAVSENGTVSRRKQISVFVARAGLDAWCYPDPPQIGDKVKLADGQEFFVRAIGAFDNISYTLEARQ